ncbi:MAG: FAD-binding protein [Candidatus Melainabacteria bacterium]
MSYNFDTKEYDVIVIGAGGAGLRAAIEVSASGLKVALVCKSLLGKAHTVMAEGGAAAAMGNVDAADDWKTHFHDTMHGGKFMNNWRMARLHAQESADRIRELELWGAIFDRTKEGKINQRPFGGHTYRRLCHVGDRTGLEMIRTLQDRGVHMGIDVFMECTITQLLKDGDAVSGAFGYWRESGRFIVFKSKAVVLATGGIGKAWKITSNSWEYTGDGHAMAYEAGAELVDSEFVQFHPTGMVWPPGVKGILVTEAVRGEGGILTNSNGERFMANYDKERMELSTRDIVAKAINSEVKAGRGSPHGGVFLNIAGTKTRYGNELNTPERIKKKLPSMYHQFKELADVDITKEPMEVGPTLHYTMGGVKVDPETAMSRVPGLFAAGECGGGMHGANRLGGNSLSDLLVFGRRAGLGAIEYAKANSMPAVNADDVNAAAREMEAPFERSGEGPYEIHRDLQEIMQNKVGIIRVESELEEAVRDLQALKPRVEKMAVHGSRQFNPGWHLAQDLKNMLVVSEAVARCALQRKESRGGHTREDYPSYDPHWESVNSIVSKDGDQMSVGTLAKEPMPDDLAQLFVKK